jgi:putative salt-induced outer membrane protein YdiY
MDMVISDKRRFQVAAAFGLLAVLAVGPRSASGQEDKKSGLLGPWKATAEISYVVTGGNTATSALSLGTSFSRKWTNDTLQFRSYILKSNATTTTRTAVGTETDFDVIAVKVKSTVAENYLLAGQYDRRISKNLNGQD